MEEIMNIGNDIMNEASGNAEILKNVIPGAGQSMEALIVSIIVGVLICFFGLKLIKVLAAVIGFSLGAVLGIVICEVAGLSGLTLAIVVFACAVIMAVLSFALYRFGVFCTVFLTVVSIASGSLYPHTTLLLGIYAGVGLLLAILAAIFVEPYVIVITAVSGGLTAGTAVAGVAGLSENIFVGYGIAAALAIIGMVVQFALRSKKSGKKKAERSERSKEHGSVESEVEQARMILEDLDEGNEE